MIYPSVISQLVSIQTLRKLWHGLEIMYAFQFEMNIIHLRLLLQQTKQGSLSIANYCIIMKAICYHILAGGGNISEAELVVYILGGLGD